MTREAVPARLKFTPARPQFSSRCSPWGSKIASLIRPLSPYFGFPLRSRRPLCATKFSSKNASKQSITELAHGVTSILLGYADTTAWVSSSSLGCAFVRGDSGKELIRQGSVSRETTPHRWHFEDFDLLEKGIPCPRMNTPPDLRNRSSLSTFERLTLQTFLVDDLMISWIESQESKYYLVGPASILQSNCSHSIILYNYH